MTKHRVGDLTRRDTPALNKEMPIRRAVAVLVDARAAAAPVLDNDGRLIGILSQKDCFRPALHASYHREWSGTVSQHMSSNVISIDIEDEVIRAAEMFLNHPHRVFPVLSGASVAGLLYRSDVLAFLLRFG